MDYTPHRYKNQNGMQPSLKYKSKRALWFNSNFTSDFVLIDNKIYEISFDTNPFEIYKFNRLKVLSYIRDSNQSKPIQVKLKFPLAQSREVVNTDLETYPIIYNNHTGATSMHYNNKYSVRLIPQQIPRFIFRLDDNINNYFNGLFGTITNGEIVSINNYNEYIIFRTSGSFVLNKTLPCDILVVGGGGGGGGFGGGGGAGQVLYTTTLPLLSGTYTITVGNGGTGSTGDNGTQAGNGQDSSITISGITYIAKGGGGGGTRSSFENGSNGGSGGGSSHTNSAIQAIAGSSNKNSYTGWISLGNNGGNGKLGVNGNAPNHGSGGGGGAGSAGENHQMSGATNIGGGNGGAGVDLSSIFTSRFGHQGWFGGGGGGHTFETSSSRVRGYANGGNGLLGGGGNGAWDNIDRRGYNAIANTGGGGGGGSYYSTITTSGGNGGSGVVIIRYNPNKRIEGITANETLIQTTNASIPVTVNSKYVINYQTPVDLPKGTYEATFSNGSITFNSTTSRPYSDVRDTNNQTIRPYIWYKFDNDVTQMLVDSGFSGFNLTNNNSTFDNSIFTKGNGSLNIASNSHVEITSAINFNTIQTTNGITFAFWFNLSSSTGRYGRLMHFTNSNQSVGIYILRANLTGELQIATHATSYFTSGYNFFNNTWNHLVWSISSTGVWSIYINGIKLNISITANIPTADYNDVKRLGRGLNINDATDTMTGKLDDFRIYNIALTDTQARQVYDGNLDRSYPLLKDANNNTINPLVWYQFDLSTNLGLDSMGVHDLTNPNGVAYSSSDFIKGAGSASFDGTNDHLTKDGAFNLNSKNFSISFWIKKTDNLRLDMLFQLGTGLVGYQAMYLLYGNDNKIVFGNYTEDLVSTLAYADNGSWIHLCFTYLTGTKTAIIYRNGVNVGQRNFTAEFNTNNNIRIGSFSGANYYKGLMDDFRIYDGTTLTATQVSELYNGRIGIYSPPSFMLGVEMEDEKLSLINTISTNNRTDDT